MRTIPTISILYCSFECHLYSQKAYNVAYNTSSISEIDMLWVKKFNLPDAILFTYGEKIVKGHQPNEYSYCTSATGLDAVSVSFYTVGRIVKKDGNGNRLWQRE